LVVDIQRLTGPCPAAARGPPRGRRTCGRCASSSRVRQPWLLLVSDCPAGGIRSLLCCCSQCVARSLGSVDLPAPVTVRPGRRSARDQPFKPLVFKGPLSLIDPPPLCVMARNASGEGRQQGRHLEWQRLINSVRRTTPATQGPTATVGTHREGILYSALPATDASPAATVNGTSYVYPQEVQLAGTEGVESTAGDGAGVKCGTRRTVR
jgi:hypothetical protein